MKRRQGLPKRYCIVCGLEILPIKNNGLARISTRQFLKSKYCSVACRVKADIINNVGKGNPNWRGGKSICDICGKELSARYSYRKNSVGKHFCKDCANNYFKGSRSPLWKGSEKRNCDERARKWRIGVFERDGYTCQKCFDDKGGNLNAHHIYNWKDNGDKRYDVENGITLCVDCHHQFHKAFGMRYTNERQLINFLK